MASEQTWPRYLENIHYSDASRLNTLEICIPRRESEDGALWIIFIHGGAWLDPEIDASSFRRTEDSLLQSSEIDRIAGLVSVNYRLSPNPAHPREPSDPSDAARNARHPDHVNDVLAALLYLQKTYAIEDNYMLVGHSCGATLAFQTAMRRQWESIDSSTDREVRPPKAILAVEGLYDLPALVKYHNSEPVYRDFVVNAFGPDESLWKAVSPTSGDYDASWPRGRLVVIAHSHEDELVEWEQADHLEAALISQGWNEASRTRRLRVIELRGKHDEVWQTSTELARAIIFTIQRTREML